jgi:UDP-glucose 4-epimerase
VKTLVTGGAGFIGSNLVNELINQGHEVTVIDNEYSQCHEKFYWNDKARNIFADIRDYELTRKYYTDVDWVFHLAAEARIQPAINNAVQAVDVNIVGTTVVLQCALESKVKKVIYSSSSSIYGTNIPPNVETQPEKCLNVYSVSKLFGEKLCKVYSDLYGLNTLSLRYFNVYGPNQPTKGEYAPVIGLWLKQAAENKPLTIVGDGKQKRSFTHVSDVVQANIKAATVDLNEYGQVFNIGNEDNYSILQIAEQISNQIDFLPERIGEASEIKADCYKAFKLLGWKAETDLMDWLKWNRPTHS